MSLHKPSSSSSLHKLTSSIHKFIVSYPSTRLQHVRYPFELARFLALKSHLGDTDGTVLSPSSLIDQDWHGLILDTEVYSELMNTLPQWIHHRPERSNDSAAARLARYERTLEEYHNAFGPAKDQAIWPFAKSAPNTSSTSDEIEIKSTSVWRLKTLTGQETPIAVAGDETVLEVKDRYFEISGVPSPQVRLIYGGKQLDDSSKVGACGVLGDGVVHVVLRLC